MRVDLDWI